VGSGGRVTGRPRCFVEFVSTAAPGHCHAHRQSLVLGRLQRVWPQASPAKQCITTSHLLGQVCRQVGHDCVAPGRIHMRVHARPVISGAVDGTVECQVQVQVCFTSVDGQVQPLDVALGHSVLSKSMRWQCQMEHLSLGAFCGLTHQWPTS
jgi:hypothetical protein